MSKSLLNISTIQAGWKIQLIREIRKIWGEEKTTPGKRIAFYRDDSGAVIIEPLD